MTQTRDLIKKMADFFTGEEFYEKGEDARLELSPDDVRCMNEIIKACGNAISRQAVLDIIHRFFTEEVDKITTKKTEDGEVLVIHKCQPLLEMNKAICKRIKTLPSASPTQNCVESALDALDCISRQDAIDAVKTRITYAKAIDRNGNEYNLFESENSELKKAIRNIENLPSVNPQEPRYYPPCEDCHNKMNEIRKAYDKIQSAEPKTGYWIEHEWKELREKGYYRCSVCNHGYQRYTKGIRKSDVPYIDGQEYTLWHIDNYCPNCGCRMVEPQESEVRNDISR